MGFSASALHETFLALDDIHGSVGWRAVTGVFRASTTQPTVLDTLTPVTDRLLAAPPASDWLTLRRAYDAHGFSPLAQINKGNVRSLRSVWS